ncbi:adenosylcobinamide-GDP ribazoletransferase [Alteromonas sp. KUL49]|uniref:adenosylcobinamide-GDP ribazoletransferase n=1 Tax=Alteromonas sp. KUL49 TaxID=2480798 RepID=UPI0015E8B229|nr:adenosylcobinamide-GDP ribazoletransferase [Alteromonas sp. KUL49]
MGVHCYCLSVWCAFFVLNSFMKRHIEGFTGDTLGAAQQVQEIAIYTVLLANS